MDLKEDIILARLKAHKQKKELLEKEYDQSGYLACIDSGRVFDECANIRIGGQLDAARDAYISDLEFIFMDWCRDNNIDLDLFFDFD